VYLQVAYKIMERKSVNVKKSKSLFPRLHTPNKIEVIDVKTGRCDVICNGDG